MNGDVIVSSIVLFTFYTNVLPASDVCLTMCGIVDTGAYQLALVRPSHHHLDHHQHTVNDANIFFSILGDNIAHLSLLLAVWDALYVFFRGLMKLAMACSAG
jgi:hypothetical protein